MIAARHFLVAAQLRQRASSGLQARHCFASIATSPKLLFHGRAGASLRRSQPEVVSSPILDRFDPPLSSSLSPIIFPWRASFSTDASSNKQGSSKFDFHDDDEWQRYYEQLLAYLHEFGDPHVPVGPKSVKMRDELGISHELAEWVVHQRKTIQKKKGIKAAARREKLNQIEFEWSTRKASFNRFYNLAVKWREENGGRDINDHAKGELHFLPLGRFLERQRKLYQRGSVYISAEQIERLKDLGLDLDPRKTLWDEAYAKLKAMEREKGSVSLVDIKDPDLHAWVKKQRQNRVGSNRGLAMLTDERKTKLESLKGWKWSVTFDENLNELRDFYEKGGSRLKLRQHSYSLYMWLHRQRRRAHAIGPLKPKHVEKLNEVEPTWRQTTQFHYMTHKYPELQAVAEAHSIEGTGRSDLWDLNYAAYCQFRADADAFSCPKLARRLVAWENVQRSLVLQGKLDKERTELLEKVSGSIIRQTG